MSKSLLLSAFCLALAPALGVAQEKPTPIDDVEAIKPYELKPDSTINKPPETNDLDDVDVAEPAPPVQPSNPRLDNNQPAPNVKTSGDTGDKIFDWRKHRGETEVAHPFAEKGLIRISKDGAYWYKVKETVPKAAMSLQLGLINPTLLRNPDAPANATNDSFEENYDQTQNPAFLISKEWHVWTGALGKLGIRAGSGAFVAQGHGHFAGKNNINGDKTPLEIFTFVAMPNSLGVVYRAQFTDRPLFVPYAEGGVIGFTFAEVRDDNKPPKFGVSAAGYAAAGLALNLTYFDYLSRIRLDHEYGITAVFLTGEYRRIQAITTRYDFSSDFINGGFLMEY